MKAIAALSLLVLCACGDGRTPALTRFSLDGQAEDSPLVLLLSLDFEDDVGDLAAGRLDTFINQRATSVGSLDLLPIFLRSDVEPDALSGSLHFVLELSFSDGPPANGTTFTLGARATDGAGNVSDMQEIKLSLESQ